MLKASELGLSQVNYDALAAAQANADFRLTAHRDTLDFDDLLTFGQEGVVYSGQNWVSFLGTARFSHSMCVSGDYIYFVENKHTVVAGEVAPIVTRYHIDSPGVLSHNPSTDEVAGSFWRYIPPSGDFRHYMDFVLFPAPSGGVYMLTTNGGSGGILRRWDAGTATTVLITSVHAARGKVQAFSDTEHVDVVHRDQGAVTSPNAVRYINGGTTVERQLNILYPIGISAGKIGSKVIALVYAEVPGTKITTTSGSTQAIQYIERATALLACVYENGAWGDPVEVDRFAGATHHTTNLGYQKSGFCMTEAKVFNGILYAFGTLRRPGSLEQAPVYYATKDGIHWSQPVPIGVGAGVYGGETYEMFPNFAQWGDYMVQSISKEGIFTHATNVGGTTTLYDIRGTISMAKSTWRFGNEHDDNRLELEPEQYATNAADMLSTSFTLNNGSGFFDTHEWFGKKQLAENRIVLEHELGYEIGGSQIYVPQGVTVIDSIQDSVSIAPSTYTRALAVTSRDELAGMAERFSSEHPREWHNQRTVWDNIVNTGNFQVQSGVTLTIPANFRYMQAAQAGAVAGKVHHVSVVDLEDFEAEMSWWHAAAFNRIGMTFWSSDNMTNDYYTVQLVSNNTLEVHRFKEGVATALSTGTSAGYHGTALIATCLRRMRLVVRGRELKVFTSSSGHTWTLALTLNIPNETQTVDSTGDRYTTANSIVQKGYVGLFLNHGGAVTYFFYDFKVGDSARPLTAGRAAQIYGALAEIHDVENTPIAGPFDVQLPARNSSDNPQHYCGSLNTFHALHTIDGTAPASTAGTTYVNGNNQSPFANTIAAGLIIHAAGGGANVEFPFTVAQRLAGVSIRAYNDATNLARAPKKFDIQYFDGAVWKTAMTISDQTGWKMMEERFYPVRFQQNATGAMTYQRWRVLFLESNTAEVIKYISTYQIQLWVYGNTATMRPETDAIIPSLSNLDLPTTYKTGAADGVIARWTKSNNDPRGICVVLPTGETLAVGYLNIGGATPGCSILLNSPYGTATAAGPWSLSGEQLPTTGEITVLVRREQVTDTRAQIVALLYCDNRIYMRQAFPIHDTFNNGTQSERDLRRATMLASARAGNADIEVYPLNPCNGATVTYEDFQIEGLPSFIDWATLDPGESPLGGLQRALDQRVLTVRMRPTRKLKIYRHRHLANPPLFDGYRVNNSAQSGYDARAIRNHVRQNGAYVHATYRDAESISRIGEKYVEVSGPSLYTEYECMFEAGATVRRSKSNAHTGSFTQPAYPFLEPGDTVTIELDGAEQDVIVAGFSNEYQPAYVMQSVAWREQTISDADHTPSE